MSAFVLDASMAMAWHFADEVSPRTLAVEERTIEDAIVVPAHWFSEVANSLLVGERRRRTSLVNTAEFVRRVSGLVVVVDDISPERVLIDVLPLARAHGLTIYDTLYLELAGRRGLPLASLDTALNDAARRVGIELVEETA